MGKYAYSYLLTSYKIVLSKIPNILMLLIDFFFRINNDGLIKDRFNT